MNPACLNTMFNIKNVPYNMRNPKILDQPKINKVTYGNKTISYLGSKIWNLLPQELRDIDNCFEFKRKLLSLDLQDIDPAYEYYV